jgi:hypothetical protein
MENMERNAIKILLMATQTISYGSESWVKRKEAKNMIQASEL